MLKQPQRDWWNARLPKQASLRHSLGARYETLNNFCEPLDTQQMLIALCSYLDLFPSTACDGFPPMNELKVDTAPLILSVRLSSRRSLVEGSR
jgi:hypothetical protein